MAKKSKKDSLEHTHEDGVKHSHKNGDKPHSHEITSATVKVKKELKVKTPKSVYDPDYKLIDDTIEDIKKASRNVCTNSYSSNNVYLFLQDCLKKIILAEK